LLAGAAALAAAPYAAEAADGGASEQIVVTAQRADLPHPATAKTGTAIEDLPVNVQVIGRDLIDAQGGTTLQDAIIDASSVGQGGTDSFGFDDRFLIRGLDARIYNDGFTDGDQRNGIPHSLTGVERVEILKGPGSALFGSGPPGGTINIVHYLPSDRLDYGGSVESGSFGAVTATAFATGPSGIEGLDLRLDGSAVHEDGFRALEGSDYELRPQAAWQIGNHFATLALDYRDIKATPDPAGLIYVNGEPIRGVSIDSKYSTPFSQGDQTMVRLTGTDDWNVAPFLTITNRFSYMDRDLSILRNGDGGTVVGDMLTGRQLRQQYDHIDAYDYELEPVWTFHTGSIGHTLLTGFESLVQTLDTERETADLPNITNIFDPATPETSPGGLVFLRDAKHSGDIDKLSATYLSLYATDQIDVTDSLKLRLGLRKDWFDTDLTPQIFVPGRLQPDGQLFEPGVTVTRDNAPTSWDIGALYKLTPDISPFLGAASSHLQVFSSESTQTGVASPEAALEYEGGVKVKLPGAHGLFTLAGFDVTRKNVFTLVGDVLFFNDQETYGVEADLDWSITPQWRLTANANGQQARLTDNPSSPSSTGKRPVGVPAASAHLFTTYDFPIAGIDGFRIGGGLNYRDKFYGNTLNTNAVPDYVTEDAVASYSHDHLTISLGVKNLTNATYFVAANGAGAFVGDPLTVYGSISWRLGG
jgi:iron complex outermembrane receptor protein